MKSMQEKNARILSLSAMLIVGIIIGSYVFGNKAPEQEAEKQQENQDIQQNASATPDSTTDSAWDKLWTVYTSPQGISFKYPRQIGTLDRCGDQKEKTPYVATKIIEDSKNGIVYVAPEYYFDYPAAADGSEDTSRPCQKIVYSLDQINGEGTPETASYTTGNILGGLNINVREVKSRAEFDKFVSNVFGPECKAEDEVSQEPGYHGEYRIQEDGRGMEGPCPMNFMYKLVYNSNKAFAVDLGQDCIIDNGASPENLTNYECYVSEIADSIRIN